MGEDDFLDGWVAYMAYLNDPTEESADELADILAKQHPRIDGEKLRRGLRAHAGEVRLFNEADCAKAVAMLQELVNGAKRW